jgi:hypothetical protein
MIRSRVIITVGLAAFAFLLAAGCKDDEGKSTCDKFCEAGVPGDFDCYDEFYGCEIDNEDDYIRECKEECNDALGELSGDEKQEFTECVNCVWDEAGGASPDCDDYLDAREDCEDECDEDGVEEFYDEFDPPAVDEDDMDCEYY